MIDDVAGGALQKITDTGVLGAVLVLLIVLHIFTFRYLNTRITEAEQRLKAEQEAHQKTRDAQLADLRDMAKLSNSIEAMRSLIERNVFSGRNNG